MPRQMIIRPYNQGTHKGHYQGAHKGRPYEGNAKNE